MMACRYCGLTQRELIERGWTERARAVLDEYDPRAVIIHEGTTTAPKLRRVLMDVSTDGGPMFRDWFCDDCRATDADEGDGDAIWVARDEAKQGRIVELFEAVRAMLFGWHP